MTQGQNDVFTYSEQFTLLARYAEEETSTDEKKQDRFCKGLNPTLRYSISLLRCENFEELVELAMKSEYERFEFEKPRKHLRDFGSSSHSVPPQKRRSYQQETPPPTRNFYQQRKPQVAYHPPVLQQRAPQGYIRQGIPQQQQHYPHQQHERAPFGAPQRPLALRAIICYKCGEPGHKSPDCPSKLPPPPPRSGSKAMVRVPPPQKAFNGINRPGPRNVTVNNVTAEEAKNTPDVVIGTLPINSIFAKVLFDTGASLSFVSQKFAQMHNLPLESLPTCLIISSPGAQMASSKISHGDRKSVV